MKLMSEWLEGVIENLDSQKNMSSVFLIVLVVLLIGAGSLYMLLNSPA
jgi:flagellar basal body-associated protein FliL